MASDRRLSFFADENFSVRLVQILRIFAKETCSFCALGDEFDQGLPDEEWIQEVGTWTPKPVILGGDGRILKNPAQQEALCDAGMHFVFLTEGFARLPWDTQVVKVLQVWGEVREKVSMARDPTVFRIKIGPIDPCIDN